MTGPLLLVVITGTLVVIAGMMAVSNGTPGVIASSDRQSFTKLTIPVAKAKVLHK